MSIKSDLIWHIPGIRVIALVLLTEGLSTYLGQSTIIGDPWFSYQKEVAYILFCIASILVLSSLPMLHAFYRWQLFIGIAIVFISALSVLNLANVLPHNVVSASFQDGIQGQTVAIGIKGSKGITRASFLWFDANNFAYLIAALIVILCYFMLTKKWRKPFNFLGVIIMFLFVFRAVATLSRGGTFCAIVGMFVLLTLFKKAKLLKAKALRTLIIIGVVLFALFMVSPAFSILKQRYWQASGLIGINQASYEVSGLETGRILTSRMAFEDFLEKPLLGRGIGFRPGLYRGRTGNHLGYLNILGKHGIIGFVLQFWLLWVIYSRLMWAIRYLKSNNDENYTLGYLILSLMSISLLSGFFKGIHIVGLSVMPLAFYLACYKDYRRNLRHRKVEF